jgi:hypothetical protein
MELNPAAYRKAIPMNTRWIICWFFLSTWPCYPCLAQNAPEPESFFRDTVQPILSAKCFSCHGPKTQKSSYRLDVRTIAMRGGDHATPPIVPGNSHGSLLMEYVANASSVMAMPPKDSQQPRLTASEVEKIGQWIDQGAVWPDSADAAVSDPLDWWSFRPLREFATPIENGSIAENPIDRFVLTRLSLAGLSMSTEADARTLARRVYFDLIGLPPTPESLDRFARNFNINADQALEQLVDRLLAMPQYGERWARHWLDVVHYGDTHGYDKDKPRPNAWPYRDYVIRALNRDKPYARFVEEQIAGDVLWPGTADGIEAMGFIASGPWDFIGHAEVSESKTDGKIARHLDRDDMISNTIGTFCSVTIHCAQCHQHKFDPITQEDYYRLQSVFSALDRTDREYYRDEQLYRKFIELDRTRADSSRELKEIEEPLQRLAGAEYTALSKRIDENSKIKGTGTNSRPEYGYHSAIAADQLTEKWVQVDLGQSIQVSRITLRPCYDDFNSIGSGFGFPVRFKIEISDDPGFRSNVTLVSNKQSNTIDADYPSPGLTPFEIRVSTQDRVVGRYLRVTSLKLAHRKSDYIFALAELQVFDQNEANVAQGRDVSALDSIESAPRWQRSNMTDGIFPSDVKRDTTNGLLAERDALLEKFADEATKAKRRRLVSELARLETEFASLPKRDAVYAGGIHHGKGSFVGTGPNGGKPRPIYVLARGQVTQPMSEVSPGAISALDFRPFLFPINSESGEGERRIALARWITDPANPLTWRSIVNRVWQYHFGRGIVDTPNDFGRNGNLPSHPELLDWLAADFRDNGGSLKRLHKQIVMSRTYRQASTNNLEAEKIDSSNTLLWRQNRRRLEAEAIRDSVLAISGKLDETMGGPGWQDFVVEHPEHSPHYEYSLAIPQDPSTFRRSIYRFVVRSQTQPWMTSLDCADPSMRVDKRNESMSSLQALALLNNGFMLTQSIAFANRIATMSDDIATQVDTAYRLSVGVDPPASNRAELIEFARQNGLPYLCRLLFNLNAFVFVD